MVLLYRNRYVSKNTYCFTIREKTKVEKQKRKMLVRNYKSTEKIIRVVISLSHNYCFITYYRAVDTMVLSWNLLVHK